MNATANEWTQIEPLLDDAMAALDETDRAAILLRYFENKTLREVGAALGASEDAAQKRVSRAVERLREFFSKRNVTIGASGLVVLISANAVQAAPVGLAVTISSAAVLAGTAISTSTVIAATKTIAMTTLQKTIITAALAAAVGTGIFEAHQASQLREQNPNAPATTSAADRTNPAIATRTRRRDEPTRLDGEKKLRTTGKTIPPSCSGCAEWLGWPGGQLEKRSNYEPSLRGRPATASNNLVTGAMADAMKQAMEQQVEGRLSRMTASLHLTPEQVQAARDILTRQAEVMSAGMQQAFSGKYDTNELVRLAKNAGNPDEQIKALLTPDQQALFPPANRKKPRTLQVWRRIRNCCKCSLPLT